ncbi:MAG: hypothetical protein IKL57_02635 [Oscillospiraceae bacterium]|nr:hypothetical protein [Oscillospiraceae bacterium]MBR3610352.1 hypothetical protein [Oscillospiraceae bacterium]
MYLLDVAAGPMYAVIGGTFLLIAAVIAAVVFLAVWLIKKAIKKNKGE